MEEYRLIIKQIPDDIRGHRSEGRIFCFYRRIPIKIYIYIYIHIKYEKIDKIGIIMFTYRIYFFLIEPILKCNGIVFLY